jgi:hypothetical protein
MNTRNVKRLAVVGVALAVASLSVPAGAQSRSSGQSGSHSGGQERGPVRGGNGFHGGGPHSGWYRGGPAWWGLGLGLGLGWDLSYFGDPYPPYPGYVYPYPPPALDVVPPPASSEGAPPPPPQQSNWYYCESTKGYYPYVKECQEGWRVVPATPPQSPQ